METIHSTAAGTIGNTPMVLLNRICKDLPAKIAVKLEYMNPTCSVKDRAAKAMIDDAEKKGLITPGKSVLIEVTSGNMGIALASYAKIKGYKIVIIMCSDASIERRVLLRAFGAELILLDPRVTGSAIHERAQRIADSHPDFHWLKQVDNEANVDVHYRTTGPEIWTQTKGKVDIACFGVGSGGTVAGIGKFLKEKKVKIFGVEPFESSVISGLPMGVHSIQGIGIGFVPKNLDKSMLAGVIRIKSEDAVAMAKRLVAEESIMGGISSGANVAAAVELAKLPENEGKLIVTSVNSFGERYLSTVLYSEMKEAAESEPYQSMEESVKTAMKLRDEY